VNVLGESDGDSGANQQMAGLVLDNAVADRVQILGMMANDCVGEKG
jgi:hypothetical protein